MKHFVRSLLLLLPLIFFISEVLPDFRSEGICHESVRPLGEHLSFPKKADLSGSSSAEVISHFAQSLAFKVRENQKAHLVNQISFLTDLQKCLKSPDIPAVQALCYMEARELARNLPEFSMSEDDMVSLLSEKAMNLVQAYQAL